MGASRPEIKAGRDRGTKRPCDVRRAAAVLSAKADGQHYRCRAPPESILLSTARPHFVEADPGFPSLSFRVTTQLKEPLSVGVPDSVPSEDNVRLTAFDGRWTASIRGPGTWRPRMRRWGCATQLLRSTAWRAARAGEFWTSSADSPKSGCVAVACHGAAGVPPQRHMHAVVSTAFSQNAPGA